MPVSAMARRRIRREPARRLMVHRDTARAEVYFPKYFVARFSPRFEIRFELSSFLIGSARSLVETPMAFEISSIRLPEFDFTYAASASVVRLIVAGDRFSPLPRDAFRAAAGAAAFAAFGFAAFDAFAGAAAFAGVAARFAAGRLAAAAAAFGLLAPSALVTASSAASRRSLLSSSRNDEIRA